MLPTPKDVHTNQILTNMSVMYRQGLESYAADRIAPGVPSDKQSNTFYKFTKDYFFRDSMKPRGPGDDAAEVGYGVGTDSYHCKVWSARKPIDDQTRRNEDAPLNSDRNAMQLLTQLELIRREKNLKATAFTTGVWGLDITGVPGAPGANQVKQWNDATSTPIADIAGQKMEGKKRTGLDFNVLAIGEEVWRFLKDHPDIIDRVAGGSQAGNPALVTRQLVATLFEVEELVICSAIENTAIEKAPGTASFTGAFIIGKEALLLHRNTSMSIEAATALRTFNWSGLAGNPTGTRILSYEKPPHVDYHECESAFDHKIVAADAGTYFTTLVA